MTPPVLPFGSLGGLKGTNTAGMRHTARQRLEPGIRQPNGEYTTTPSWSAPVCCHLAIVGAKLAEIAAAQGIEATWSLKVPGDTDIPAASTWQVTDDCGRWTETVKVTGDLVKHGRVMRLVAAVDTTLNRP